MPAIEFSRLRTKIELLGRVYDQPGQFVKDLSDLYFFYSDLTFQPNNPYVRSNSFPTYRTPVVINRELERSLKVKAKARPEETLNIIDTLWATRTLEPCQLAAALLGAIPIQYTDVVLERILNWSKMGENPELVNALQTRSTETLRREQPELWLQTLGHWYDSKEPTAQKLALMGLIPMIDDPNLNNLPLIFDYLQPIIAISDSHLAYTLLTIIEKLAVKSESETVYFLKQLIKNNSSDDLPRFIRRALPSFSESAQSSLKTCLREN
jgi:hypothetical protein